MPFLLTCTTTSAATFFWGRVGFIAAGFALLGRWAFDDALGRQLVATKAGIVRGVAFDLADGGEQMAADILAGGLPLSEDTATDHGIDVLQRRFAGGSDFEQVSGHSRADERISVR